MANPSEPARDGDSSNSFSMAQNEDYVVASEQDENNNGPLVSINKKHIGRSSTAYLSGELSLLERTKIVTEFVSRTTSQEEDLEEGDS